MLFFATGYQVSGKVARSYKYEDSKVIFASYNFTESENKTYYTFNNTLHYLISKRHYSWTVIFSLGKSPEHYVVFPYINYTIRLKTNESVNGRIAFLFNLYVNGKKISEAEQERGFQIASYYAWGKLLLSIRRGSYYLLHRGKNNLTATVTTWWWIPENISVDGHANYTLGPFEVIVGELRTIFGLQPEYLLPGAVLILPISVALEIMTRNVRKKLKRIEE